MAHRTFLHVATTKSGTTFLQRLLWSHREHLLDLGILLPGKRKQHFLAALDVRNAQAGDDSEDVAGSWAELVEERNAWAGDAVISHELFAPATRDQADRAIASLEGTEVHVVITARDLARQIPSEWQEHLKHRSVSTFPEFVQSLRADVERGPYSPNGYYFWHEQDVAAVVRRWGARIPSSRVHVVTAPPRGADPGVLWQRFAGLIGVRADGFDLSAARRNRSVQAEQAELLRRLNMILGARLPLPGPYPGTVKAVLAHDILTGREGTGVGVVGDDHVFAVERSRAMVAELRRLRVDVVGDLQDLIPGPEDNDLSGDAAVTTDAVLVEAIEALAEVLQRLAAERSRSRRLRSQLDEVRGGATLGVSRRRAGGRSPGS